MGLSEPELFTKAAVETFRATPEKIEEHERIHYNQLRTRFDESVIRSVLKKWGIPIESHVTIYGGYTGQFASALLNIGMKVVFTDASDEWVAEAKSRGVEAYKLAVQKFPREILQRTDLFASFECYPDLFEEDSDQYVKMRLLTAKYGIFFAESRATTQEMNKEQRDPQELGTFRRWFRPLNSVYGLTRRSTMKGDLNFYHIMAGDEVRGLFLTDLKVMKAIYDNFPRKDEIETLGNPQIDVLSKVIGLDQNTVEESFRRMQAISDSIHSPFKNSMPFLAHLFKNQVRIGGRPYKIELQGYSPSSLDGHT